MSNNTPSEARQPGALQSHITRDRLLYASRLIVLATAYFIVAALSTKLASLQDNASPVWPPSGLAIGALIIFGYRYAAAIFIGAFFVDMYVLDFGQGDSVSLIPSIVISIGVGVGNTLEALAGAYLVKEICQRKRTAFSTGTHRFCGFVLSSGRLLPPFLSAGIGVTSLHLGGLVEPSLLPAVSLTWLTGDIVGILTVTPLMLCLWSRPSSGSRP